MLLDLADQRLQPIRELGSAALRQIGRGLVDDLPGVGATTDVAVDSAGTVTTTRLDRRGRPQSTRVLRAGEWI